MASIQELRPMTSTSTRWYSSSPHVDAYAYHTTTAPGLRPLLDVNSDWESFIHPEGRRYFRRQHHSFFTITEENVLNEQIDKAVSEWVAVIEKEVLECGIILPQACELFVELRFDELPHASTCAYYFVDHHSRSLFWLEPTSSELLDMGMLMSNSHLDIALERLYWVHVEFFPMHVYAQISPDILDNLIGVLCHGMADRLTSPTSTFLYTDEKCRDLLHVLSLQRGRPLDGHTLCFVARLWGAIDNQRFMTYYGQENAQLDRLQLMTLEDTIDCPGIGRTPANFILFGVPGHYHSKLHGVLVYDLVYVDRWQALMTECISEWRGIFSWAFSVLIASILIAMLPRSSVSSAMAPILAALLSMLSGSILLLRHRGFEDETSSFAVGFLSAAKSTDYCFVPLSVVYSMPKVLYLWSLGLVISQFLFWVSRVVGVPWALGGACSVIIMGYGILYFTPLEDDLSDSVGGILRNLWHTFQSGLVEGIRSMTT